MNELTIMKGRATFLICNVNAKRILALDDSLNSFFSHLDKFAISTPQAGVLSRADLSRDWKLSTKTTVGMIRTIHD